MTNNQAVDPVALARAVASLSELAQRYAQAVLLGKEQPQIDQALHVLGLSYNALGVVLVARAQGDRVGQGPCEQCDAEAALIYDTCDHGS
jgi:hypothetical protein